MARTRYQRADQSDSDCTPGADVNKPLLSAQTGGNETAVATVAQGDMNVIEAAFIMEAGDPGDEDLAADSLFRCQFDVTVIGSNLTFRAIFHAYNASCTSLGSAAQAEGDFSGTGLHLATATWDPPAGADRYAVEIQFDHGGMHSDPDESCTFRTNNVNAFFEIPDAPSAPVPVIPVVHAPRPPIDASGRGRP